MKQFLLCSLILATTGLTCRATVILSISPSQQTVALGSKASVDVDVSGLGNGTALGTYDLNASFDAALLSYSSISFGNQLDISGLGDIQTVSAITTGLEIFELSLDSVSDLNTLQATSFRLFTLTFGTLAEGINSPLTLSVNALGDANGNPVDATLQNGSITIASSTVIPEPPSGLLLVFPQIISISGIAIRQHLRKPQVAGSRVPAMLLALCVRFGVWTPT